MSDMEGTDTSRAYRQLGLRPGEIAEMAYRRHVPMETGSRSLGCPFCKRVSYGQYDSSTVGHGVVAFEPLNPVTPGHMLVVPAAHVRDALEDPELTAAVFRFAAQLAKPSCNLITSAGAAATQTVWHFHVHIVPRRAGDGLHLPWTGQKPLEAGS